MEENTCVFCRIIKGEIPADKVVENEEFIVIKDANPRTKGHSLVIPKEHYVTFETLPAELYESYCKITREAIMKIKEETDMNGYNFIMNNHVVAGQVVPHMHLHIVPRYQDDQINTDTIK